MDTGSRIMIRKFRLAAAAALFAVGLLHANSEIQYPDPERWADKIREFREWDSKNTFPKEPVLFVGSSSIVRWKTAESFPNLPVINRGFGGSYAAETLYYLKNLVLPYQPRVVVFYAGDNDIAGSLPAERVHQDFVQLFESIHEALPETKIICLAVKLSERRWNLKDEYLKLNKLNRDYAETKEYLTFVDTAAVLLKADGMPQPGCFLPDKLHLSEKGYARWNDLLSPVLAETIK